MNKHMLSLGIILALLVVLGSTTNAAPRYERGHRTGTDVYTSYRQSVGDYFGVPEREVASLRQRGIADEELPVVYFIASRAKVSPRDVVDLRHREWNWSKIANHYGLTAEDFYVPYDNVPRGPHFRNAYEKYRRYPRNQWRRFSLTDGDIIDLVNLRIIADRYGVDPRDIISARQRGSHYYDIDRDMSTRYSNQTHRHFGDARSDENNRSRDRDHNRGNDQGQPAPRY